MKKRFTLILGLAIAEIVASGSTSTVNAFIQLPRPRDGKLYETCSASLPSEYTGCKITVNLTDNKYKIISLPGFPATKTVVRGTRPHFFIPKEAFDVRQTVEFLKTPILPLAPTTTEGPISDLSIESVFFDPDLNQYVLGNIIGTVAEYSLSSVSIPDIYADTNNDGIIGDGDILYSLVDLNEFLKNGAPSFTLGDPLSIVNGKIDSLPGMLFSATPFSFTPENGFTNTTYFTGQGNPFTTHDIEPIPEPTSTLSLLALGTLGAASTLKRKLKSSKLTEKETTKVS
jgi:hypothetical protein